jgi:hypothetical protein
MAAERAALERALEEARPLLSRLGVEAKSLALPL